MTKRTKASRGVAQGYAHAGTVLDAEGLTLSVQGNGEFTDKQRYLLGDPQGVPYVRLTRESVSGAGEQHHLLHPRGAMALGHALHLAGKLLVDEADQAEQSQEPVEFLSLRGPGRSDPLPEPDWGFTPPKDLEVVAATPQDMGLVDEPGRKAAIKLWTFTQDGTTEVLHAVREALTVSDATVVPRARIAITLLLDELDRERAGLEPQFATRGALLEQAEAMALEQVLAEELDGPTVNGDPELTVLAKLYEALGTWRSSNEADAQALFEYVMGQLDAHAQARRLELAKRPVDYYDAREVLGDQLVRVRAFLERESGTLAVRRGTNLMDTEGEWTVLLTFGQEDPDSDMAAGQAIGVSSTLPQALEDALGQARA